MQLDNTINNKKRCSGTRSMGGRREATQLQTKDNNGRGEGIGAMHLWPTRMAAGAPSNTHVPGERGADKGVEAKTTIGGGEMGAKMGLQQ